MSRTFHHEKKFRSKLSWAVGEKKRDKRWGKMLRKSDKIEKIEVKEKSSEICL